MKVQHDGDGKIYLMDNAGATFLFEVRIYEGDEIAKRINFIINRSAESKDEIANGSVASGQGSTNSAITQLPPECGKCIHKRVCPAWVLSLNNAMDVSINRCLYFEAATAQ